jgi:hypothetical protein
VVREPGLGLVSAVVYLFVALPAVAQSQAFATISIKPTRSADPGNAVMRMLPDGDLIASAVPVIELLSYPYDVPVNPSPRLSRLPDWTLPEKYDIEAKAPANAIPSSLLGGQIRSRIREMIRELLADRFRLVMRAENQGCQSMLSPLPGEFRSSGSRPSPNRIARFVPDRKPVTILPAAWVIP